MSEVDNTIKYAMIGIEQMHGREICQKVFGKPVVTGTQIKEGCYQATYKPHGYPAFTIKVYMNDGGPLKYSLEHRSGFKLITTDILKDDISSHVVEMLERLFSDYKYAVDKERSLN